MKIYEIIDEENAMSAGVLLYYEKEYIRKRLCMAETLYIVVFLLISYYILYFCAAA